MQGFEEQPLQQTVREIVHSHEAPLAACQAGRASAEQLHSVLAALRLLERSVGVAPRAQPAAQPPAALLPHAEAQLQLLPFAQAALAALAGGQARTTGFAPLHSALPPQLTAAAQLGGADGAAVQPPLPPASGPPGNAPSATAHSAEQPMANGDVRAHEQGAAPDLAASLPQPSPQTPVLAARVAKSTEPHASVAGNHVFAGMQTGPEACKGSHTDSQSGPRLDISQTGKASELLQ